MDVEGQFSWCPPIVLSSLLKLWLDGVPSSSGPISSPSPRINPYIRWNRYAHFLISSIKLVLIRRLIGRLGILHLTWERPGGIWVGVVLFCCFSFILSRSTILKITPFPNLRSTSQRVLVKRVKVRYFTLLETFYRRVPVY